ncbi:MAG TPA: hypothetical protein VIT23_04320, partial [Terrimicrobiaceae bacterium]
NGNPFSNGTFFPSGGTFQAIMRGKNLTGVATFSTIGVDDSSSSGGGIYSVFFDGITYVGNVNAAIDVNSGKIAATFEGSLPRLGEGSGTSVVNSEFTLISESFEQGGTTTNFEAGGTTTNFEAGGTTTNFEAGGTTTNTVEEVVVNPDGTTTTTTTTTTDTTPDVTTTETTPDVTTTETTPDVITSETTPDTLTQEFGLVDTVANFSFIDTLYSAGAFVATLSNSYPNQAFDGKGTFSFTELNTTTPSGVPELVVTTVKIKVDGVRVSDTIQTFTPVDVQVPAVFVTFETQTGGGGGGGG